MKQSEVDTLVNTAREINSEADSTAQMIESRMVEATWTLRRMPDREFGFLQMRNSLWPDTVSGNSYPTKCTDAYEYRRRVRITAKEIDNMQPTLDLLTLLPDVFDRQIVFWTCWHQDGEVRSRVPWAKVRRSLGSTVSRWTLKRRHEAGLKWLAALVELQR